MQRRLIEMLANGLIRSLAAAIIPFILTACAVAPVHPPESGTSVNNRVYQEAIEIGGRLSAHYQQNGEQALFGNFTWSQTPKVTTINLLSPFGQAVARIQVEPGRATFRQNGQPIRTAADADLLVQSALGWPLPVAGLRSWLQGFISSRDGNQLAVKNADGAAVTTADGWSIVYTAWEPGGVGMRPRRIDMTRKTKEAGDVSLRIVIDEWRPASVDQ